LRVLTSQVKSSFDRENSLYILQVGRRAVRRAVGQALQVCGPASLLQAKVRMRAGLAEEHLHLEHSPAARGIPDSVAESKAET
jgi:ferredoxin-NADP reductase